MAETRTRNGEQRRFAYARSGQVQRRPEAFVLAAGREHGPASAFGHNYLARLFLVFIPDRPYQVRISNTVCRGSAHDRTYHFPYLCRHLDQGEHKRHAVRRCKAHLGQAASPGLVQVDVGRQKMSTGTRIVPPVNNEVPFGQIRSIYLPQRDSFARRARRLEHLMQGHTLGDYIGFATLLSHAQQEALDQFPAHPLPGADKLAASCEEGLPLLNAVSYTRNQAGLKVLRMILQSMRDADLPQAARDAAAALLQKNGAHLEKIADNILAGNTDDVLPQELPFIGAGLQVYWAHTALSLGEDAFGITRKSGKCPVCGSYPVAGAINTNGARKGLRYLTCSLCTSE